MKILIKVTKDVLKRSMMCNFPDSQNCAIAIACREFFPNAAITVYDMYPFGSIDVSIHLPIEASRFVSKFDSLAVNKEQRLNLPEFSFEVEVPEPVLQRIGISEAYRILSESKTLELVMP